MHLPPQTDHLLLPPCPAGLCLNCWSLQELVSRDPGHFLILLEQILQKTREVQEEGTYDLLAPLALLFYSTVLCVSSRVARQGVRGGGGRATSMRGIPLTFGGSCGERNCRAVRLDTGVSPGAFRAAITSTCGAVWGFHCALCRIWAPLKQLPIHKPVPSQPVHKPENRCC